jgi:LacI family transcriptional regulator
MKKKVSLKDIAEKLGVSIALVSYVLNNQKEGRIGKEISKKIRAVAKRMNYQTNQIARSLKTNKTYTIGLIVGDISNPFYSGLASIIEAEAEKNKYTVIFGSSHEDADKYRRVLETLMNRQVDGLIIAPPEHAEPGIKRLQKQGVPFVLVDRYFPAVKANYVILDNYDAAWQGTKHLIAGGRKRIGMITYKTQLFHLIDRKKGYREALKEYKIPFTNNWLKEISISNNKSDIEMAVKELLSCNPPIDALLLASNSIANHAVKYINTLSIKVPEALAILCFDETESLDLFYAPLTYLKQPLYTMGQMATNILLENIRDGNKIRQVEINAELIIRKSTERIT